MRILFLIEDWPITPNGYGGASALAYSRLEFLNKAGHDIYLVMLFHSNGSLGFREFTHQQTQLWQEVQSWLSSYRELMIEDERPQRNLLNNFCFALKDPVAFAHSIVNKENTEKIKAIIEEVAPDIIWAEHRVPAVLASRLKGKTPIVYSHHDWAWRINYLRHPRSWINLKFHFCSLQMYRAEKKLVRIVCGCLGASITEVNEMKTAGAKCAQYIPVTYAPVGISRTEGFEPLRIVHVGGMRTTASRKGLERFLDIIWPQVKKEAHNKIQLWIIGDLTGASQKLKQKLEKSGAIITGFVLNLENILRPFDIHILPWECNTGTRARLPLAFNFSQVVVATKKAVACAPEAKDSSNCVLVSKLPDMTKAILDLCRNYERRKVLGLAARETFLKNFTREALQPWFNEFLQKSLNNNH
jgi:glycosyltransferase involved in cell wall biosynthesis